MGILIAVAKPTKPTKRTKQPRKPKRGPAERCRVDGAKLRALRIDAELSIRELAYAVEVDPKTITELEAGRREWSQLRVIRSIAAHPAINVAWAELLVGAVKQAASAAPSRQATSSLDAFVEEERRGATLPVLKTPDGVLPNFGAGALVNVFSSPASHAGATFYVRGHVVAQRGLASGDGRVLGIDPHAGSRFLLARKVGGLDQPLTFTLITTRVDETRSLQRAWELSTEIVATIRVVVADLDSGAATLVGSDGEGSRSPPRQTGDGWRGFVGLSAAARPHPWALLVLRVV